MTRLGIIGGIAIVTLTPVAARPQGLAIDHKAVGCIVVGKFPKMNACFTPPSALARSRVYFRPEGVPSWYYVEMKSDQPCFTGTLPKPGKKLVGKKIEYYLEAQDKTFNPARTAEFDPIVVRSAQECEKDVPVAPFVNNATVAVFPSLPAGFAAGGALGTGAVLGIVGAGAAVAGTAAVVASNDDTTTTTTLVVGVTTTTAPAVTTTTTTTTTTTPPGANRPPFAVLSTNPNPPKGFSPLTVTFDMCKSTDPDGDPLSFFFDFGDGAKATGACVQTHTYTASSFRGTSASAPTAIFRFRADVVDPSGASQGRERDVEVEPPPPACAAPTIAITKPKANECFETTSVDVSATATATARVRFVSDEIDCDSGATITPDETMADVDGPGPTFSTTLMVGISGSRECYRLRARAFSACGPSFTDAAPVPFVVDTTFFGCGGPPPSLLARDEARTAAWSSDLTVPGGRLQVIVNGTSAAFPDRGRSFGIAQLVDGQNRVEAVLADGAGKPGMWRIDLRSQAIQAGSIRVIAGDVVVVASSSVTFRLAGTPGERLAFTFIKK